MRKNKLVAFVTAFSVIASMCGTMLPAYATDLDVSISENEAITDKGIELVYDEAASNDTTKVVNAYYRGIEGGILGGKIEFAFPENAIKEATYTTTFDGPQFNLDNIASGVIIFAVSGTTAKDSENNLLATFTFTVDENAPDFELKQTNVELMDSSFKNWTSSKEELPLLSLTVPGKEVIETPPPITDKGIELVYDEATSNDTTKVVNAYYRGMEGGILGGKIEFTFPENAIKEATYTTTFDGPQFNLDNIASGVIIFAVSGTTAKDSENNLLATFTFTVDATADAFKLEQTAVELMDSSFKNWTSAKGELPLTWVMIPGAAVEPTEAPTDAPTDTPTDAPSDAPTDAPTATPEVITRPTLKPTAEPVETAEPIETPPAITDKGIELVYDEATSNDTTKVVNAYYRGMEGGILGGKIEFTFPENAIKEATYTTTFDGPQFNLDNIASGVIIFAVSGTTAKDSENNLLATFTFTVDATADAFKLEQTAVELMDSSFKNWTSAKGELPLTWVMIPGAAVEPTEAPTAAPTVKPFEGDEEVAVGDFEKVVAAPDKNTAGQDLAAIVVKVTKDGKDATYGEDYVAKMEVNGEVVQLTEEEFKNVINGLTPDGTAYMTAEQVKNAAKTLVISAKYGVKVSASAAYVDAEDPTTIVTDPAYSEDKTVEAPAPTPTATATAKPTATPAPTSKPSSGGSGSGSGSGSSSGGAGGQLARPGITGSTGTTGTTTGTSFQDLGSVPWAATQINTLASLGILNGYSSTEFGPNGIVTRAEFTKMVCAALGISANTSLSQKFVDVSPSDWFYGYVMAAADKGVVLGVSDTAFDPNRTITRQEMATILYRAINAMNMTIPTGTAKTFADAGSIEAYAVPAVNALSAAGVINGVSDTMFAPTESATRAQAACIIYQYYQAIGAI